MDSGAALGGVFFIGLFAAGVRLAVPLLLTALGEIFAERSGVINLGLEGFMLTGAFTGYTVTYFTQRPILGLLAGVLLGGLLLGAIVAFMLVTRKTSQVITGIIFVILAQGLVSFAYRAVFGSSPSVVRIYGMDVINIPFLANIPILGPILFRHSPFVYIAILAVLVSNLVLFRTTFGLNLRAIGEDPLAAETQGLSVTRIRYVCVLISCIMASLSGAYLTVGQLNFFTEGVTAGRGWIVIALVIFANWHPVGALGAALLFGIVDALQMRFQVNLPILPYELLLALPYALAMLALATRGRSSLAPAALGIPYEKE